MRRENNIKYALGFPKLFFKLWGRIPLFILSVWLDLAGNDQVWPCLSRGPGTLALSATPKFPHTPQAYPGQ